MRKSGASLIWSVIICGVLMTIATTIATSVVKESQMGIRMDDSAKAYAAAESGQEWAKWCLSNTSCRSAINIDVAPNKYEKTFDLGDSQYTVEISKNADGTFQIMSIGHSHGVNREIEYTTKSSDEIVIFGSDGTTEVDKLSKTFRVDNSGFSLSFDYWTDGSVENFFRLTSGTDKIEFITNTSTQAGKVDIKAYQNETEITTNTSPNSISLYDVSPYSYKNRGSNRIYLYYQPSVGIKIEVYSVTGAARGCVGTKTIMFDTNKLNFAGSLMTFSGYGNIINTGADQYYSIGGNNFDNFYATGLSVDSGSVSASVSTSDTAKGSVSVTPVAGGSATFTAAPASGYVFSSWSGDCTGTVNPLTVNNIVGDISCVANFKATYVDSSYSYASTEGGYAYTKTYEHLGWKIISVDWSGSGYSYSLDYGTGSTSVRGSAYVNINDSNFSEVWVNSVTFVEP